MAAGQSRAPARGGARSVRRAGFDQTTATEIAARAGVTGRTFFRHFADKRELLFGGSALLRERIVARGGRRAGGRRPHRRRRSGASTPPPPCSVSSAETSPVSATRIAANPELRERELAKLADDAAAVRFPARTRRR
jgi:AcrR family transcriptional regulator